MSLKSLKIEQGYYLFSKGDYKTQWHSHYAIELVICPRGSFQIKTDSAQFKDIQSVVIPPNLSHDFDCLNAECKLLFVDPLSNMGQYFISLFNLPSRSDIIIDPPELQRFLKEGKFDISSIFGKSDARLHQNLDPRIIKCIDVMDARISDNNLTLSQLAKESFLSESRLAHLFKKQLGISVHQCILWKRIQLVAIKSRKGLSLTECAHYAGFSDSSHLTKVFYNMFGIYPSFVLNK